MSSKVMIVDGSITKNVSVFMFCTYMKVVLCLWFCGGLCILKLHELPVSAVNNDVSSSISYICFCCAVLFRSCMCCEM